MNQSRFHALSWANVSLISRMVVLVGLSFLASVTVSAEAAQSWVDAADFLPPGYATDGSADYSAAIQKAIDTADGREVRLPGGKFRLDKGLRWVVSAQGPGLKIVGAGMGKTILAANFDDGALLEIGTSAPRIYQIGGYIRDLTLTATGKRSGTIGASVAAYWFGRFERVEILDFPSDGLLIPLLRNLSANPDDYQDLYLHITQSRIVRNRGWGVNGAGGHAAAGLVVENSQIVSNGLGGLYMAAQMIRVTANVIGGNGEKGGGGVVVDSVHATPNGVVIQQNEFDANHDFNLWLRSAAGGDVSLNRFISKERQQELWPPTHVLLSDQGRSANNVGFTANYHRSDSPSDLPLTLYQVGRETVSCEVRNPIIPIRDNTKKLTKYAGLDTCAGCQALEGNRVAVPGRPLPASPAK